MPSSTALSSSSAPSAAAIVAAGTWQRPREKARTSLPPSMLASYMGSFPPAPAPGPVPPPLAFTGRSIPQVHSPAILHMLLLLVMDCRIS